jgi:hypothetical protein
MTATVQAAEDIREIRGPKAFAESSLMLVLVSGTLLVIACVYFLMRRRRTGPTPQAQSLSEQTLERLENTRPLMRSESAREFGIAVSEAIRTYIERRFGVLATQQTTEEFLHSLLLKPNEALARHRTLLDQFLHQSDFVKFAGASPATADMESLLDGAQDFVRQTAESPPAS